MNKKSSGFSVVEILIVIAVVVLLGFIGYRVWSASNQPAAETTPTTSQTQKDEAPQINEASDLNKADSALDSTNVEGDSSQQLESELQY